MKIGTKILKEAAVLLLAAVLVVSTVAIADTSEPTLSSEKVNTTFGNPIMDEIEIKYYDEDNLIHVIGVEGGTPPYYWASAVRFTQDELMCYASWNLTKLVVYLSTDNGQSEVEADLVIYGEGTPTWPGDEIYREDDLFYDASGRYEIDIAPPIPLSEHNELWLAMWWTQTEEPAYIPVTDDGPAVDQKGDWCNLGSGWAELQNWGLDYNWGMGGIIEGEGTTCTTLGITDPTGPIGVSTGIKNTGDYPAENVVYEFTVQGGILGMIDKNITGDVASLDIDAEEPLSSGIIIGLGNVDINIMADADNAFDPVSKSKSAFVLGFLVLKIQ
jgi:hypothetical protein